VAVLLSSRCPLAGELNGEAQCPELAELRRTVDRLNSDPKRKRKPPLKTLNLLITTYPRGSVDHD
jgi:hypothetical protein